MGEGVGWGSVVGGAYEDGRGEREGGEGGV